MMPAGIYYIGDLCYVMSDERWEELCDLIMPNFSVTDGEFLFKDGVRFAPLSTFYGDGVYEDQVGHQYPVDSGSIGCILLSDIEPEHFDGIANGRVVMFLTPFEPCDVSGTLKFGDIAIETNDTEPDEEED